MTANGLSFWYGCRARYKAGMPAAGLAALIASFLATAAVAISGPSVMEPPLSGRPGQPPWTLGIHPSGYLVVGLAAFSLGCGAVGLMTLMRAIRAGWRMPAWILFAAGLAAAVILAVLPPFGSSDPLSYAVYGRMVVTGHNPYLTTPALLAKHGDPVAGAVLDFLDWKYKPSVYGPLASGIQALASEIGGSSVRLTVLMLDMANLLGFAGTALLLYRVTDQDKAWQLRAMLLWVANPLLLQVLVAGGHVDSQMIVFAVASVAVLYCRGAQATMPRSVLAGALAGLAFAVKVTGALAVLGLAIVIVQAHWAPRHATDHSAVRAGRPWRLIWPPLTGLAAGFAVTAGAALAIGGSAMLRTTSQASSMVSIGSPWRPIRDVLQHAFGHAASTGLIKYSAVMLAVLLACLLVRAGCYPPLALMLAWLFAWPYVLPWYDALGWAFLGLAAASELDWLLLARTTTLGLGYLPAWTSHPPFPAGLGWLLLACRYGIAPVALTVVTIRLVISQQRRNGTQFAAGSGKDAELFGHDRDS